MNYQTLSKKLSHFSRYTGLSIAEFNKLAKELESFWQEAEIKRLSRPNRKRKIGGGRKYKLGTFQDKLLLILAFYKLSLNYEMEKILIMV